MLSLYPVICSIASKDRAHLVQENAVLTERVRHLEHCLAHAERDVKRKTEQLGHLRIVVESLREKAEAQPVQLHIHIHKD